MNKGHITGVMSIDFSEAFDIVFNEIVFPK